MWKFNSDSSIYTQIIEQVESKIIVGEYKSGGKFPSVRELAIEAGVNPNTVQKAIIELEQKNLVETIRNVGRQVTSDLEIINNLKKNKAHKIAKEAIEKFYEMGLTTDEILELMSESVKW